MNDANEVSSSTADSSATLWRDRKRTIFGLPLSFTVYRLTSDRLFIESGFLNKHEDEVRLYRVLDVTLDRPLSQRIFRVGTITCDSSDVSEQQFRIGPVKKPKEVMELLSQTVEVARKSSHVMTREFMSDDSTDLDGADGIDAADGN
jgi:uncharacterized membrane protein YdbT with pleckstrin-like domain